jgi:hypothetical protein
MKKWIRIVRNALGYYEWFQVVQVCIDGTVKPLAIRAKSWEARERAEKVEKEWESTGQDANAVTVRTLWVRADPS